MPRARHPFRKSYAFAFGLAMAGALPFCGGCSSTSSCTRDPDTYTVSDGVVFGNTYISAPNDAQRRGPWAPFPSERTLIFEHRLGAVPYQISIWLAFQPLGTLAPAAGNSSIRQLTPDDATIAIKNDTCSDYWAWLEASVPTFASTQGDAGASEGEAVNAAGAPGAP